FPSRQTRGSRRAIRHMSEEQTKMPPAERSSSPADEGLASRMAAAEILYRVDQESGYADVLLGGRLPDFPPADRRLITRLVLGTLAWRGRLDYELAHLTGRKLEGIQPAALAIMRMGLFQLRFLDRIPQHAVVDTAVSIAKRIPEASKAAGFVNAVMRRATRETAPMPARERNEKSYLAVMYSHPRWMVERFVDWFGVANAERLMTANNDAAPNVIRLNLARGDNREIERRRLRDRRARPRARDDRAEQRAAIRVARVSRGPVPRAIRGVADGRANAGAARGRVIAVDLNLGGLRNARGLARRLRHRNVEFVCADLTAALPLAPSSFESVFFDAPCTGIGTLREHPEIKWRLKPGDPARMAAIQSRMLENAAAIVGRAGAIVYSVCSIAPEEGEGVVEGFLARHADFEIDRGVAADGVLKDVIDARGFMKTRPDVGGLDGFFAARLVRRRGG